MVDVNVHPNKKEVRFSKIAKFMLFFTTVKETLNKSINFIMKIFILKENTKQKEDEILPFHKKNL